MKITYTQNPLNSIIELDEHEQKELWYKIKLEIYEEMLFAAHFHLKEGKYFNLDKARTELEPDYWCTDDEKSKADLRADQLLGWYLDELKGPHIGDCTCVAMSCGKCHAEDLLGINTIKGLGKHSASKIRGAFKDDCSIDEAIANIEGHKFATSADELSSTWRGDFGAYAACIPRWTEEKERALAWLKAYREQYFLGGGV